MGVETGDLFSSINEAWPLGGDDFKEGDDHLRFLKHVLKFTFNDDATTFIITKGASVYSFNSSSVFAINGSAVAMASDLGFKANLFSPNFTGDPKAPTPTLGDNDTTIATTAFVQATLSAATGGTVTEAPNDGALYGRQSLGWQKGVKLAGDTMTGALSLPLGNVTATALNFGTPGTGFYTTGTASIIAATSGASRLAVTDTGINISVPLKAGDGTISNPGLSFLQETGMGLYRADANDVRMTIGSTDLMKWLMTGVSTALPFTLASTGSAAANQLNFGTAGTGINGGSTSVTISTAGVARVTFGTSITSTVNYWSPFGSAASPTYTFSSETSTGLYATAGLVGLTVTGTARLTVTATAATFAVPAVLPSSGSGSATALNFGTAGTGFYGTSSILSFAASGTTVMDITSTLISTYKKLSTPSSTAILGAFLNLGAGAAPNSPQNGDVWMTTAGMYVRASSTTYGPLGAVETAAEILAKLLTVDGAGSALDADLLDAQTGTYYLSRANHTGTQAASTISDFNTAADARIAAAVGVTVQAYDADLSSWAAIAPATKLDASKITVASTAPGSPATNDVWIDTT